MRRKQSQGVIDLGLRGLQRQHGATKIQLNGQLLAVLLHRRRRPASRRWPRAVAGATAGPGRRLAADVFLPTGRGQRGRDALASQPVGQGLTRHPLIREHLRIARAVHQALPKVGAHSVAEKVVDDEGDRDEHNHEQPECDHDDPSA